MSMTTKTTNDKPVADEQYFVMRCRTEQQIFLPGDFTVREPGKIRSGGSGGGGLGHGFTMIKKKTLFPKGPGPSWYHDYTSQFKNMIECGTRLPWIL